MHLSHRRTKLQRMEQASRSKKPLVCRACGGTSFIYGEKHCMCKSCRVVMPKPRSGYFDADGKRMIFTVYGCKCGKLFTQPKGQELKCPKCGELKDFKVVRKW